MATRLAHAATIEEQFTYSVEKVTDSDIDISARLGRTYAGAHAFAVRRDEVVRLLAFSPGNDLEDYALLEDAFSRLPDFAVRKLHEAALRGQEISGVTIADIAQMWRERSAEPTVRVAANEHSPLQLPDGLARTGIRPDTLHHDRFRTSWVKADDGAYAFEHQVAGGFRRAPLGSDPWPELVGMEIVHPDGQTAYASVRGQRGVWSSAVRAEDARLVVVEKAVDALAYHQLTPDHHDVTRYVSLGVMQRSPIGHAVLSEGQREGLNEVLEALQAPRTLVAAVGGGVRGDLLTGQLYELVGEREIAFRRQEIPEHQRDWVGEVRDRERDLIDSARGPGREREVELER